MFLPIPIVKAMKITIEIMLIADNIKDVTFSLSFIFLINEIIVKTTNKIHIPKMIKRPIILFSEKISSIPLPKIGCKDLSSKPAPKLSVYITHKYNSETTEKTKLLIKWAIFINITPYITCLAFNNLYRIIVEKLVAESIHTNSNTIFIVNQLTKQPKFS